MKFSQETHPGNMPIRVLQYNITSHFETIRDDILNMHKENIDKGKVKAGISYIIFDDKIITPKAKLDSKEIIIQENFLSYIWAIAYSLFVIYENAIQKKMIEGKWKGILELDTPLLQNAIKLFNWAINLKDNNSIWPVSLPNPENPNNEEEKWWIEKVNGIFLDSVTYILFHEYAHLTNNHIDFIYRVREMQYYELSENEKATFKEIENEADIFAVETIIKNYDSEKYKLHKGIAIVIANISLLFLLRTPKEIKQPKHPDVDIRIFNALNRIGIDEKKSTDYLWYFACISCKIFFDIHKIPVVLKQSETVQDLFYQYLEVFDNIKSKKIN